MDLSQEKIIILLCSLPAFLAGLTVHEFAHAWAADKLGDPTPRSQGRLTLDPIVHIDPFGALFFIISSLAGFGLGWAKPVMTNSRNLKHPRRDSLLIAIAGPISNILQVPIWLIFVFIMGFISTKMGVAVSLGSNTDTIIDMLSEIMFRGVIINVMLAAFNMIPIPPLDGHWVLQSIGGRPIEELFDMIRPYSFIILIVLLNFTPLFSVIVGPPILFSAKLANLVAGFGAALAR